MFHHFHGGNHAVGQGSISASDLDQMISWLKKDFEILNIEEFYVKALEGSLNTNQTCLTFDDSLLCQYEIALPVIESHGFTALFNVYSSAFSGRPDPLEVYRYFRSVFYQSFDEFFDDFFLLTREKFSSEYVDGTARFLREGGIYDAFPFYTRNDKVFRFFRDKVLGPLKYNLIMNELMKQRHFDASDVPAKVFMNVSQLEKLHLGGHSLGLHSDTHPTQMHSLPKNLQFAEYAINHDFLKGITGMEAKMVAHPCGDYNETTLEVLQELEVKVGFRSSMGIPYVKSLLEIPREDHSNIFKKMGNQ